MFNTYSANVILKSFNTCSANAIYECLTHIHETSPSMQCQPWTCSCLTNIHETRTQIDQTALLEKGLRSSQHRKGYSMEPKRVSGMEVRRTGHKKYILEKAVPATLLHRFVAEVRRSDGRPGRLTYYVFMKQGPKFDRGTPKGLLPI